MSLKRLLLVVLIVACAPEKARPLPPAAKHASTTVAPDTRAPVYNDALPSGCVGFVPHTVGSQVTAPIVIRRVEPEYPETARKFSVSAENTFGGFQFAKAVRSAPY